MSGPIQIIPVKTPSLGDTSYVVHDGTSAILLDPQRDIERFVQIIERHGLTPEAIVETHVHNDYVSGGPALADLLGARIIVPAGAAPAYRHVPAFHHEEQRIGSMRLTPIHTPGHTPEHTSYLIGVEDDPTAVFTGGSMLVGAAGRSDLLGTERAESLARLQYRSLRRLADLDGSVEVHPTHGPGSFCAASTGGSESSTIRQELDTSPVLRVASEDEFVEQHLSGLPSYPAYYRHMAPLNLAGGGRIDSVVPEISASVASELTDRAAFVDARPAPEYARAHIPGSLWVGAGESFSSWVGWLVDIDEPIVLIPGDADPTELATELGRIGFDHVIGHLDMKAWSDLELETSSISTVTAAEWNASEPEQVLDVRDGYERAELPVPGAIGIHVPDLEASVRERVEPEEPVWVTCASGYRSMIAGSLLEDLGLTPIVLLDAGAKEITGG